jgi:hypothetical protein
MAKDSRRMTGRLLLALNLAAANLAALACVVAFVRPSAIGVVLPLPALGEQRLVTLLLDTNAAWAVFLGGLLLLLANLWWLLRRPASAPPVTHVISETAGGPIRISRDALEGGLRSAGEQLPEITRLRVTVDCGAGRRVLVLGQFQCAEGVSNLQASQRLRTVLQDRFNAMVALPASTRAEFDLEFQGFAGKLSRKPGDKPVPEEASPFTGPKYPIEEEETSGGMV